MLFSNLTSDVCNSFACVFSNEGIEDTEAVPLVIGGLLDCLRKNTFDEVMGALTVLTDNTDGLTPTPCVTGLNMHNNDPHIVDPCILGILYQEDEPIIPTAVGVVVQEFAYDILVSVIQIEPAVTFLHCSHVVTDHVLSDGKTARFGLSAATVIYGNIENGHVASTYCPLSERAVHVFQLKKDKEV